MITQLRHIGLKSLIVALALVTNAFAEEAAPPPPERANQGASRQLFSTSDIQFLYGSSFHEPGVEDNVTKRTFTLENSSGWTWGSSYFFIDYLRSDAADDHATEFYGEWYPSLSIGKVACQKFKCPLKDVLLTMGFNAGTKSTGASPLVFLPGVTLDFKLPLFQFFSLGIYAYIDRGRINGLDNGSNDTTYQITPSWSLPFGTGRWRFRFDGFIDFIGEHGESASQIVSQPTIKLDLGNLLKSSRPDRLFAGVEWGYWRNKYGIEDLHQSAPQAVVMWVF
jgi:nucleoside-specific outer membrane channel protein Tsx